MAVRSENHINAVTDRVSSSEVSPAAPHTASCDGYGGSRRDLWRISLGERTCTCTRRCCRSCPPYSATRPPSARPGRCWATTSTVIACGPVPRTKPCCRAVGRQRGAVHRAECAGRLCRRHRLQTRTIHRPTTVPSCRRPREVSPQDWRRGRGRQTQPSTNRNIRTIRLSA
jgi:hypothetical protein